MHCQRGEYTSEINEICEAEWTRATNLFMDANIFQSWGYGSVKWGSTNSEHVVLKKGGTICSIAQVAIVKPPLLRIGIAYVTWGPLWRRMNYGDDATSCQEMVEVLKGEYARRRKFLLRVKPRGFVEKDEKIRSILEMAGFLPTGGILKEAKRTILVNLEYSQEEMRKRLSKKWRNSLTNSEKENLRLKEGFGVEPLYAIRPIYEALQEKKNFEGWDLHELARIQKALGDGEKMRITTCEHNNEIIAASVCSALGDTAVGLIGVTSEEGRKRRAYYLLQWDEILWAKKNGQSMYDLNGINPQRNPTVYHFKSGINGEEVIFLGVFDYCQNKLLRALANLTEHILKLNVLRKIVRRTPQGISQQPKGSMTA